MDAYLAYETVKLAAYIQGGLKYCNENSQLVSSIKTVRMNQILRNSKCNLIMHFRFSRNSVVHKKSLLA